MIRVGYVYIQKEHYALLPKLLLLMPKEWRQKIAKFKNVEDQLRSVIGKLLLKKMLVDCGHTFTDFFAQYQVDSYKKPFIEGVANFNISHSGNYVVCAISEHSSIGIDIEKHELSEFQKISELYQMIATTKLSTEEDFISTFYKNWAQKEAISKAIGKGLSLDFKKIIVQNNQGIYNNKVWNLNAIPIHKNYTCHIAYQGSTDIQVNEVALKDLF